MALARQYRAKAGNLQTNESALERLIGVSDFIVKQHRTKSRTSWKGLAVCHHRDVKVLTALAGAAAIAASRASARGRSCPSAASL